MPPAAAKKPSFMVPPVIVKQPSFLVPPSAVTPSFLIMVPPKAPPVGGLPVGPFPNLASPQIAEMNGNGERVFQYQIAQKQI